MIGIATNIQVILLRRRSRRPISKDLNVPAADRIDVVDANPFIRILREHFQEQAWPHPSVAQVLALMDEPLVRGNHALDVAQSSLVQIDDLALEPARVAGRLREIFKQLLVGELVQIEMGRMIEKLSARMKKSLRPGAHAGRRIAREKDDGTRRCAGLAVLDDSRNRRALRPQDELSYLDRLGQVASGAAQTQEERKRVSVADDGREGFFERRGIALLNDAFENEVAKDRIARPKPADLVARLGGFLMQSRRRDVRCLRDRNPARWLRPDDRWSGARRSGPFQSHIQPAHRLRRYQAIHRCLG